ncbi:MAG TPA: MFS transporter [Ktedonosporobacter sp.]|nr:MFS transporter [Ktedonosporobacter sp.]
MASSPPTTPEAPSEWAPLRIPLFRIIWLATLAANIGTWFQNVGGVWLMTTLTPSPVMVALMQTATSASALLVCLPAGALADIVNRRQLLLWAQGLILTVAIVLSILTFLGATTPWVLLTCTFLLGMGANAASPAWQAVTSELVPADELPAAVTLNSVSFNLARAVGPALAGVIVALAGSGMVFLLNAIAAFYVVATLYRWHTTPHKTILPAERMSAAVRTGVRFIRHSPEMQTILIRTFLFIFFISGFWALLPVVVRHELKLGSLGYGIILGCIGIGAVAGAALLPGIQRRFPIADTQVAISTIVLALVMVALGLIRNLPLLCLITAIGGISWIMLVSNFNVSVQEASPAWVRARALGAYLVIYQGGNALGSLVWGLMASWVGNPAALLIAAIGAVVALVAMMRWRLADAEKQDLRPWHTSEPKVLIEPKLNEGPVLIKIEYSIDPQQATNFIQAMYDVGRMRERDGASSWSLYYDPTNLQGHIEVFLVESWVAYLRQLDRMTVADHAIEDRACAFHQGSEPPPTRALVADHIGKFAAKV